MSEPARQEYRQAPTCASARRRTRSSRSPRPSARSRAGPRAVGRPRRRRRRRPYSPTSSRSSSSPARWTSASSVDLIGPLTIHHVENSGIAFGLFGSRTTIVIAITAIAVGAMLVFFARSGRRHPVLPVALGLVLGGSISNLIDRVRLGHVTDFLDLVGLARVQPRGHVHRRGCRHPLRRARPRRSAAPAARSARVATLRFSVAEAQVGSRLDRALAERPEVGTRSLAERLLRDGAVTVDGAARAKSHRLEAGSVVEVELPEAGRGLQPRPATVPFVYEDEHLARRRQARRHHRSSRERAPRRHARRATAQPRCGAGATIPTGPASCIGSTATPRG